MTVQFKITCRRVHAIVRIVVLDLVVVPAISNSARHIGIGSAAGEILTGTRTLLECLVAHKGHDLRVMLEHTQLGKSISRVCQSLIPGQSISGVVGAVNVVMEEHHVLVIWTRGEIAFSGTGNV